MKVRLRMKLLASICLLLAPGAGLAETTKLRYGAIAASVRNIQSVPLYIAQEKGFLARQNLELEIVQLPGVEHMVNELDKGNVDVSFTATPYLIQAVMRGSDSVGVIGGPQNTIYSLVAKPGVKSFADLKNKTIAMSLPIDAISIATRLILAKHGLSEGDYGTKVLIGTVNRAQCLASGACDAAPLAQPEDFQFVEKGYAKLGDSLEVISQLQFSVVAARRGWAREHGDELVRLARAMADAYRFMGDPTRRDEVVEITARTTGAAPQIARKVLEFFYDPDRGVMPRQAEINIPGLAKVIDLLVETGALPAPGPAPDRFIDTQYLHAAGLQ